MSEPTIATGQAAKALGISKMTLLRWMHDGHVSPAWVTPNGQFRWNLRDLEHQLDTGNARATAPVRPDRPQTDASKPQRPAVIAAVVTSRLGVLAVQRRDGKPPWSFPAGESEPGESPADTIVREVKEETGLLIKPGAVIAERIHPRTGRHLVYLAARPATRSRDVIVGDDLELSAVRWLTRAQAEDLMPDMAATVHQYLTQRLTGTMARGTRRTEQLPWEAAS